MMVGHFAHLSMSRIIWFISKAAPVGVLLVFISASLALVDFFTHFENAIVRWLCAAVFALYWPASICATILNESELDERVHLIFTGVVGFVAVSAGCLYDHFFPHFAQHRTYGEVPEYSGLKWTMGASLLFGFIMAIAQIQRFRPSREPDRDEAASS